VIRLEWRAWPSFDKFRVPLRSHAPVTAHQVFVLNSVNFWQSQMPLSNSKILTEEFASSVCGFGFDLSNSELLTEEFAFMSHKAVKLALIFRTANS